MVWGLHPYTRHNPQKLDVCIDRQEPVCDVLWCELLLLFEAQTSISTFKFNSFLKFFLHISDKCTYVQKCMPLLISVMMCPLAFLINFDYHHFWQEMQTIKVNKTIKCPPNCSPQGVITATLILTWKLTWAQWGGLHYFRLSRTLLFVKIEHATNSVHFWT